MFYRLKTNIRKQEMKERISSIEDTIKKLDLSFKENFKSNKGLT